MAHAWASALPEQLRKETSIPSIPRPASAAAPALTPALWEQFPRNNSFGMKKLILGLFGALMSFYGLSQSLPEWAFDKKVHDFGKVTAKDGPLDCTFTLTNTGKDTLYILMVSSSCNCTSVKWTRKPVAPGEKASISATYDNKDANAGVFDKTLNVYTSAEKRPAVLHIRGVVRKN